MFLKLEFFLKDMKCEAGDNRDHLALMLIPRPDKPESGDPAVILDLPPLCCVPWGSSLPLLSLILHESCGLLHSSTVDIWGWFLFVGGLLCAFSSNPDLYPPDGYQPPAFQHHNQKCLQTLTNVPWGAKLPLKILSEFMW